MDFHTFFEGEEEACIERARHLSLNIFARTIEGCFPSLRSLLTETQPLFFVSPLENSISNGIVVVVVVIVVLPFVK